MDSLNAREIRKSILQIANRAKSPHIGSALSCTDIICALYGKILNIPFADSDEFKTRDIFLLSKAHSAMALYATLYHKGFLSKEQIEGYYKSTLPAHTDRLTSPYIEISAGSLGHGLPIAVGMALGFKLQKQDSRKVFILMGDGEIQEGSVWEAAMFAPKYELNNLVALVDRNNLQGYGRADELLCFENLVEKFSSFGWEVKRVNGHDEMQISNAITSHNSTKPLCVICDTIKGKGVSFMEDALEWHYYLVTDEVLQRALKELV